MMLIAAPAVAAPAVDLPITAAKGGWIQVNLQSGTKGNDFHLTYESGKRGHYIYFDGKKWGAPVAITAGEPVRMGVPIAVDKDNVAHMCWSEGGFGAGTIQYRRVARGLASPSETVTEFSSRHGCHLACDDKGQLFLVARAKADTDLTLFRRAGKGWAATKIPPSPTGHKIFDPRLASAGKGSLYLVSSTNRKPLTGQPVIWWKYDGGTWTEPRLLAQHHFEMTILPTADGFIGASMRSDKLPYLTTSRDERTKISDKPSKLRNGTFGLARTKAGTLYVGHTTQNGAPGGSIHNRAVAATDVFYYAVSSDGGHTWEDRRATEDSSGQGWGTLAANGNTVMLVWPDNRGGGGLYYRLIEDQPRRN
jgi:hypothetical protein